MRALDLLRCCNLPAVHSLLGWTLCMFGRGGANTWLGVWSDTLGWCGTVEARQVRHEEYSSDVVSKHHS